MIELNITKKEIKMPERPPAPPTGPTKMPSSVDGIDTSNIDNWDRRESGLVVPPGSMSESDAGSGVAPKFKDALEGRIDKSVDEGMSKKEAEEEAMDAWYGMDTRSNTSNNGGNGGEGNPPGNNGGNGGEGNPPGNNEDDNPPSNGGEGNPPGDGGENGGEGNTPGDDDGGEGNPPGNNEDDNPPGNGGEGNPPGNNEDDNPPGNGGEGNPPGNDDGEGNPPGDGGENGGEGNTPEDENGGENGEENEEPTDIERRAAEADAELEQALSYLDSRVENYARARIALERIFGGKNQEIYDAAERDLHDGYARLEAARARSLGIQMEQLDMAASELQRQGDLITENMQKAQEALENAGPDDDVSLLRNNVQAYEAWKRENETKIQTLEQQRQEILAQNQAANLDMLNQVQQRVDASMIEQREAKHPRLAKFNEWMKKHPLLRIAASATLVGVGVLGVVTGNVPLIVGAMAGKAALAGYGGYNIVRGLGENRATTQFEKAEINGIGDYTDAAERQSTTRRRSKKGGAALGAALASIPVIKGIQSIINLHPEPPVAHPQPPTQPQPPTGPPLAPPAPPPPDWVPNPTDGRFPWTHMADQFGAGQATPRIMEIAQRAPDYGWQIIGNGQGGGSGAILRMISPSGQVFTDNASFNSILDHLGQLMNNGPTVIQ
jgi:hypothetical protein